MKVFESFWKMENLFFFPLTLSAQPILPFFFSFPRPVSSPAISPRQPVPRRPVSPLTARSGPAPPPPPCLAAKGVPPVGSVSLPRPSRTQAQSPTRSRAPRRRVPLGPARQGPCSAPIKGTLDPLEILNPKPQPPPSKKPSPRRRHC